MGNEDIRANHISPRLLSVIDRLATRLLIRPQNADRYGKIAFEELDPHEVSPE
jgi:hypothetical protein